jgi:hypothetical protein
MLGIHGWDTWRVGVAIVRRAGSCRRWGLQDEPNRLCPLPPF